MSGALSRAKPVLLGSPKSAWLFEVLQIWVVRLGSNGMKNGGIGMKNGGKEDGLV
jgi:hypothetical protein